MIARVATQQELLISFSEAARGKFENLDSQQFVLHLFDEPLKETN